MGAYNRHVKFQLKIPNHFGKKMSENLGGGYSLTHIVYNCCNCLSCLMLTKLELYRILATANPESGHFWKSGQVGSGQISSQIWQIPVQLEYRYVQVITDKPNAADLSHGVFTILVSVTPTIKIQNSLAFHKFRQLAVT